MIGIRSRLFALTCFVMFLSAFPVAVLASPAQKPILEMIPKEAAGFVVLSDLSRADQAATTLGSKMQMPLPGPSMILQMMTGLGDAIDSKGSLAAIYFTEKPKEGKASDPSDFEPPIGTEEIMENAVFVFPVNDFDKVVTSFPKTEKVEDEDGLYRLKIDPDPMLLTSKDGYALLVREKSRKWLDVVLKSKTNVVEELKPHKEWIDQQIFYGFLTQNGLDAYSTGFFKFALGTEGVVVEVEEDEELEIIEEEEAVEEEEKKSSEPNTPQKTEQKPEPEAVSYKDDFSYLAMGIRIDDAGMIYVTARLGAKPGTLFSKDLSVIQPLSDNLFASLPQGTFSFAGGGALSQKLKELLNEAETVKEVKIEAEGQLPKTTTSRTAWPTYKSFRGLLLGQSYFVGPPREEQTVTENITVISWTVDTQKSFDAIKKDVKGIQEWFNETMKDTLAPFSMDDEEEKENDEKDKEKNEEKKEKKEPFVKVTAKEATIEGCKTLVITYDLSNFVKRLEEQIAKAGGMMPPMIGSMFEKIYGKDNKIVEYNIQLGDHRILSTYCSNPKLRAEVVKIAKAKTGGLADDEEVKKVLALLPVDAQWKGLLSPQGTSKYIDWYYKLITSMIPAGILPFGDKLPECQSAPPVGMAGVASKELLEVTVVIPPDTLRNSIQYIMQLQAMLQPIQPEF